MPYDIYHLSFYASAFEQNELQIWLICDFVCVLEQTWSNNMILMKQN